jgi:FRG domain
MSNPVESWSDFLKAIDSAKSELSVCASKYGDEFWYRGQTHGTWDLIPSLFRHSQLPINVVSNPEAWTLIWEEEQDLYFEFSARARELHGKIDDWDVLFAMQHYGVPTRLLDWTETLGVAVYFALHEWTGRPGERVRADSDDPPCVWVINPYELNHCHWGVNDLIAPRNLGWSEEHAEYWSYSELLVDDDAMDWDLPVAVYPQQRTDRMQAQRGWFTIHGDVFQAINHVKGWKKIGRKVDLPTVVHKEAFRFLEDFGLSLFTLFPDLPSLAVELSRKSNEHFAKKRRGRPLRSK